jgi:GDPmannose 4,6-dehydratase
MKKALITGITGQTGAYLAAFLLKKNYIVFGIKRRTSSVYNTSRLEEVINFKKYYNKRLFVFYSDLNDYFSLNQIIKKIQPDEIYNLAAQSHVQISFEIPEYTTNVNSLGVLNLLNIIKNVKKKIKFYQASTSEMFGNQNKMPLNENSTMEPASPYGISKLYSYHLVKNYRESYRIFASNGILFNHESPLRGENFITRKITIGISEIYYGLENILEIGNFNSKRDWGHARDYAEAIWKILQVKKPMDLIISTNKSYSIRDFIKICFKFLKIKVKFIGKGVNEKVVDNNGKVWIKINKKYIRPKDINNLKGNPNLAKKLIGWKNKTSFKNLVEEMISSDLAKAKIKKQIINIK